MRFTLRRNGRHELTMAFKHYIGGAEIAMVLFTRAIEGTEMSRAEILRLVRDSVQEHGTRAYAPECGVDISDGYEDEFAEHARWAIATVRRLWPELDDDTLRQFEKQYVFELLR